MQEMLTAVCLGTVVLAGIAAPANALEPMAGKKFSSCNQLQRQYPNGVAESRAAARRVMDEGFQRPAISRSIYAANYARLDADYDGVLCENISDEAMGAAMNNAHWDSICRGLAVMNPTEVDPECKKLGY